MSRPIVVWLSDSVILVWKVRFMYWPCRCTLSTRPQFRPREKAPSWNKPPESHLAARHVLWSFPHFDSFSLCKTLHRTLSGWSELSWNLSSHRRETLEEIRRLVKTSQLPFYCEYKSIQMSQNGWVSVFFFFLQNISEREIVVLNQVI